MSAALEAARDSGLLAGARGVLVLLSGGRDSVCLLDVAVTLRGAAAVRALHVDYGLRPQSGEDAEHCRAVAHALGVDLELLAAPAPPDAGNLQAWARALRYAEAERRASAQDLLIATGHTRSDQAETVLYRLAASPGRRALLGMAPRRGRHVRPLLEVGRGQTAEHCRERGLGWREDVSNEDPRFARSRIRSGLLSALREVHPAAEANVARTARLLREEAEVLDAAVEEALAGDAAIEAERLAALPPALARLVSVRLAEEAAGAAMPAVGARVGELLGLAGRGGSGSLDVGQGVRAVAEYGRLRFERGGPEPAPREAVALAPGARVRFGTWTLWSGAEGEVVLGARAARGGLIVRERRSGDRMRPLGRGGGRSLADLMGERRIPRARRPGWPVLECDGEIAWVPEIGVDERFAPRAGEREAIAVGARDEGGPLHYTAAPRMHESGDDPAIGEILVPADVLQRRVRELAAAISEDYAGRSLLLVGVLKGAVFFLSDLMRHVDIPVEVDFMAVASYGSATDSSGVVRILKDLDVAIEDRDVLIVEDIVDSGLTLQYLMRNLGSRGPRSLEVCALLTKPARRKVDLPTRYVGFEIADRFAIGYGLDHGEQYRNLPYVAALRSTPSP